MTDPEVDRDTGEQVFRLSDTLTIADSGDLYRQFSARLDQGGDIALDAGVVTRVDAAIIQLLYQVQRALQQTDNRLAWTAISPEFRRCVSLLGLSEHLQIPAHAPDSENVVHD